MKRRKHGKWVMDPQFNLRPVGSGHVGLASQEREILEEINPLKPHSPGRSSVPARAPAVKRVARQYIDEDGYARGHSEMKNFDESDVPRDLTAEEREFLLRTWFVSDAKFEKELEDFRNGNSD